ncbi:MAG: hypothetical protein HYY93_07505 [Planctomycetes bacterium]|nr:hypothetical protein [Planctomycetota bacterium]
MPRLSTAVRAAVLVLTLSVLAPRFAGADDGKVPFDLQEVAFTYADDNARAVCVIGDFNCWNEYIHDMQKGPDGVWKKTLRLRKGRVYEYGFSVDGKWVGDSKNPVKTASGHLSILFIPGGDLETALAGGEVRADVAVTLTYKKTQEQLDAIVRELAALRAQSASQAGEVAKRDAELELLRNQVGSLRLEKTTLARDLDEARKQFEELNRKYDSLRTSETGEAKIATLEEKNKELTRSLTEAQNKLNKSLQEKLAQESLAGQTLKDYADLKKQNKELDDKCRELMKEIEEKNQILAATGMSAKPPVAPPRLPPRSRKVLGEIQVVSPDTNILIVTAGSEQGLKEGDELVVLREGEPVGRVIIEGVHPGYSSAHAPEGMDWRTLSQGDQIAIEER